MYPTVESSVDDILSASWSITDGYVVPKTEDIVLKNGGRRVQATWAYADLAGSTKLAHTMTKEVTAKVVRAYVSTATRIFKKMDGEIRSFDGDRVMAIFMGSDRNDRAVRAALGLNWAVYHVLKPAFDAKWTDFSSLYTLGHGIGIDTGEALIVRGGVRDNNDLISIGDAPNDAARLSEYRSYPINITAPVHDELSDEYLRTDQGSFWSREIASRSLGSYGTYTYHSSGWWEI